MRFRAVRPDLDRHRVLPHGAGRFRRRRADDQVARLDAVLANNGYSSGHLSIKQRHQALAFVLLLNHSPWLDDLSWTALARAASLAIRHAASIILGRIAKALVLLGIIAPAADDATREAFPL